MQRPCLELPRSVVAIDLRRTMPEMLTLPQKHCRPRQDEQPNGTHGIEEVGETDRINSCGHRENEDGAKDVPHDRHRGQRVADDFCHEVST